MIVVQERLVVLVRGVQTSFLEWWLLRQPRERLLLTVAGALAVAVIVTFGFWRPLQAARTEALAEITAYETASAQIRALGRDGVRRATASSGPASAALADAAASAGVTLRRVEPDDQRTRASLEDVDLSNVLAWLDRVERGSGLEVLSVKLDRRPAPGLVNAEVTVAEN